MPERTARTALHAGDTITVDIEKPAAGGSMIARHEGQVVLVAGAIPGERVTVRIDRVARSVAHARTVSVETPSADRREPFADPTCGGGAYSHIAYPRQLEIKAQVIADAFARIGKLPLPAPVRVAGSPEQGYRMRARLHVRGSRLGFFREGSHEICDARATRQLLPATCDTLDAVMAAARSLGLDSLREIELSENVAATERVIALDGAAPLDVRTTAHLTGVGGLTAGPYVTDTLDLDGRPLTLRRHVLAFFQGNRYLLRDLAAHVAARVAGAGPVADLYAGAGLFAIAAALVHGVPVVAVEGDRYAADDLRANAAAAPGVTAVRGDVETFVAGMRPVATAIVDPPRTGMTPAAIDGLVGGRPSRVIYVSCDVATLARDARRIVDAGYGIEEAAAFDLFPNSAHVETTVVFGR
jgi:23S rRNA (uracil1939-C5)-methyltransferase